MSYVENLAAVVCRSAYEDLSKIAREQLKIRVLDSLGAPLAPSKVSRFKLLMTAWDVAYQFDAG